ncbi:DUF6565 domain-containing protein [Rufibacter roseolus]|uniref:DUF6565 domain-containing protein n=1 Tax=Rufibacter roseolus TaxID=2817375 RepID=UPI001B3123DB|nr:DUF6565 domain-containing protein [Rufibacter roseolus]
MESLVQEVETNQKSYSEEEWSEVEERYLTLCAERIALYENKLNSGEREKINRLIGKYNAIKVKHDLRNIKEDFHDLAGQTRSFINELSKEE